MNKKMLIPKNKIVEILMKCWIKSYSNKFLKNVREGRKKIEKAPGISANNKNYTVNCQTQLLAWIWKIACSSNNWLEEGIRLMTRFYYLLVQQAFNRPISFVQKAKRAVPKNCPWREVQIQINAASPSRWILLSMALLFPIQVIGSAASIMFLLTSIH